MPLVFDGSEVEWEQEVGAPLATLQAGMGGGPQPMGAPPGAGPMPPMPPGPGGMS